MRRPGASSSRTALLRSLRRFPRKVLYLAGYATECGLKALLLSKFRPRRHKAVLATIKSVIGHDLLKLVSLLEELARPPGFGDPVMRDLRVIIRVWHSEMRYNATERSADIARKAMACLARILDWLEEPAS